jgi:hypothetical protein
LRKHGAATYNVPIDSVFQLSGHHALIAQKFLADYQKNGNNIDVKNSNTVKDVLEAYSGVSRSGKNWGGGGDNFLEIF